MIDEDRIIFTDNDTIVYDKIPNSPNRNNEMIFRAKSSDLRFDECVKLNIFKKPIEQQETDFDWNSRNERITRLNVPDESLVYLTENQNVLESYVLQKEFEQLLLEKKMKESNSFRKKKFESVKTKLYENRNPNIQNLLKDLVKKPAESSANKLKDEYKSDIDTLFKASRDKESRQTLKSSQSDFKTSRESKKISRESKKISRDSKKPEKTMSILETQEDNKHEDVFMTESDDLKISKPGTRSTLTTTMTSADKKFEATNFELKYKHLLKGNDSDDSESESTGSTMDLMKEVNREIGISEETEKKEKIKIEEKTPERLPSLTPLDPKKVAREMQIAIFNTENPTETSFNRLNQQLDEIKQIYMPSFQNEFHQVCQYGSDAEIVKLITEDIDYDVNKKQNGLGRSCIHECCINGNVNMLKGLLPYVDDIDKKDKNGQTACHICAKHGELDCLKVLAANSANLLLEDKDGMQLSHLAAKHNHPNIIEFLFQMGISLKTITSEGKLPLHYAAEYGAFEALNILTEYYVDISQIDNDGNYAAHLACMSDKLKCLKYLIKIGTPINGSLNGKGRSLAHVSCLNNSVNSLHWLLENGADIYARDYDGNTIIHLAGLGGSAECMNCCLQHDFTFDVINNKNETPIDLARKVGKSLHIQKAISNEIRCKGCVKLAIKHRWDLEHEKTTAEKTIDRNKQRFYRLKQNDGSRSSLVATSNSKANRDLIAQYFGPAFHH